MIKKKTKINFIFIHIRKNILPIMFILFAVCLIIFSKDNLTASKEGLTLWMTSVVPALLPFFIACELLTHTDIIDYLGKHLSKIMRPIFNVPGEGAFPLVMGIISRISCWSKNCNQFQKKWNLYKGRG